MDKENEEGPRGGHGGSVEIIGDGGVAEGGNGGRGGSSGCGRGGDGGGGTHYGTVYARGGDGGDAGRPARPALGAASPMSYVDSSWISLPSMTDVYGIPQPGKGGDSHIEYVYHDGYWYCLNVLLRLIQGPIPEIINSPDVIDAVDGCAASAGIQTGQVWWDLAVREFPEETSRAMSHIRECEGH